MVKNLVGPPVVGEDFVGRKEELAEAVRMISQKVSQWIRLWMR